MLFQGGFLTPSPQEFVGADGSGFARGDPSVHLMSPSSPSNTIAVNPKVWKDKVWIPCSSSAFVFVFLLPPGLDVPEPHSRTTDDEPLGRFSAHLSGDAGQATVPATGQSTDRGDARLKSNQDVTMILRKSELACAVDLYIYMVECHSACCFWG